MFKDEDGITIKKCKEDFIMLFMNIYAYKEGKREEIIKRRLEIGTGAPDGVKIIGEWTYKWKRWLFGI